MINEPLRSRVQGSAINDFARYHLLDADLFRVASSRKWRFHLEVDAPCVYGAGAPVTCRRRSYFFILLHFAASAIILLVFFLSFSPATRAHTNTPSFSLLSFSRFVRRELVAHINRTFTRDVVKHRDYDTSFVIAPGKQESFSQGVSRVDLSAGAVIEFRRFFFFSFF